MWRFAKIVLSIAIPLLFIVILYFYIDFNYFFEKVQNVEAKYLFLSFAMLFGAYFFRIARFMILFSTKSVGKLFGISTLHYFFNRIMPARSGEATLPVLLKKYLNISYSKGITGLVFLRLIDFYGIILILVLASLRISVVGFQPIIITSLKALTFLLIIISVFLFLLPKTGVKILSGLLLWIAGMLKQKLKDKLLKYVQALDTFIHEMPALYVPGIVLMSFGSWLLIYLYYYFIILSFGLPFTFPEVTFASSISNLTLILPLSAVGNIGTFEAGWTAGFALLGMEAEEAVQIGFFSNIYATIITSILALAGWMMLSIKKH